MKYVFKSKKVEELGLNLKGDTVQKLNEAAYKSHLETLAILIKLFGVDVKDPYEAIDSEIESGKTVNEIYAEVFEGLNKSFFDQKLIADMETPPMNFDEMFQEVMQKMKSQMTESMTAQAVAKIMPTLSEEAERLPTAQE